MVIVFYVDWLCMRFEHIRNQFEGDVMNVRSRGELVNRPEYLFHYMVDGVESGVLLGGYSFSESKRDEVFDSGLYQVEDVPIGDGRREYFQDHTVVVDVFNRVESGELVQSRYTRYADGWDFETEIREEATSVI